MIIEAFEIAGLIIGAICWVICAISNANYDGSEQCNKQDCDDCPLPCDERSKRQ